MPKNVHEVSILFLINLYSLIVYCAFPHYISLCKRVGITEIRRPRRPRPPPGVAAAAAVYPAAAAAAGVAAYPAAAAHPNVLPQAGENTQPAGEDTKEH